MLQHVMRPLSKPTVASEATMWHLRTKTSQLLIPVSHRDIRTLSDTIDKTFKRYSSLSSQRIAKIIFQFQFLPKILFQICFSDRFVFCILGFDLVLPSFCQETFSDPLFFLRVPFGIFAKFFCDKFPWDLKTF